jgi:hypothetical protein
MSSTKWSDEDFCLRVKAHAERLGLTITELMSRAGLTEDYLRRPPEYGRNIAGILKIAEAIGVNPAELMGLEASPAELRSAVTIAHIVAQQHFNLVRTNGDALVIDIEKIVAATLAALKEYKPPNPPKSGAKTGAKPKRPV